MPEKKRNRIQWPLSPPPDAPFLRKAHYFFSIVSILIGILAIIVSLVCFIIFIAIGQPILILVSFIPAAVVWTLVGGIGLKDLAFLIWWNSGKD